MDDLTRSLERARARVRSMDKKPIMLWIIERPGMLARVMAWIDSQEQQPVFGQPVPIHEWPKLPMAAGRYARAPLERYKAGIWIEMDDGQLLPIV